MTKIGSMLELLESFLHSNNYSNVFLFQKGVESTTLYAILGAQDEGILVPAFERDYWGIPQFWSVTSSRKLSRRGFCTRLKEQYFEYSTDVYLYILTQDILDALS